MVRRRGSSVHQGTKLIGVTTDLTACGSAPFHLLRTIFPLLHGTPTPSSTRRAATLADSLLRLSNERILCYNYKEVPTHWRRLYTDATLLHVLAALSSSRSPADLLSGIRSLDLILIVAGAPGPSRPSLVFSLITHAQSLLPPTTSKRPKLSPRPTLPSPHLTSRISSLTIPPSLSQFLALISQGPFILRSGCSDWPALSRWSSFAYLRSLAGPGRVVPVELGGNYTSEGWGQRILPFEEFLQSLESEGGEKLYLAQHDLFRQFPELERDVAVPDYVYSAPEAEGYEAPGNEEGYVMNAWLGPEGTVSPAHTDPYFNCYGPSSLSGIAKFLSDALFFRSSSRRQEVDLGRSALGIAVDVHVWIFARTSRDGRRRGEARQLDFPLYDQHLPNRRDGAARFHEVAAVSFVSEGRRSRRSASGARGGRSAVHAS